MVNQSMCNMFYLSRAIDVNQSMCYMFYQGRAIERFYYNIIIVKKKKIIVAIKISMDVNKNIPRKSNWPKYTA